VHRFFQDFGNVPVFLTADELSELVEESDDALRPAFL